MSAGEMPHDPFEAGDMLLDLLGHGGMLKDALMEASERGRLFDAVGALGAGDLRAAVIAWVLGERFTSSLIDRPARGSEEPER